MTDPGRILIVKLSAIGDCLHATPALEALRQTFPGHTIDWAVHPHCAPVVEGNPFVSEVIRIDRKQFWRSIPVIRRTLRAKFYDTVLDQQGLLKSGLVARLSSAKRRLGPAEARERAQIFYTGLLPDQRGQHIIDCYLNRAATVGATWTVTPRMFFPTSDSDRQHATALRESIGSHPDQPLVVLNPSAGKPFKQWAPENFAALGARLTLELGVRCVITGAPADRPLADAVLAALPNQDMAFDLTGRTNLHQLAAFFATAQLFVGGDTGPMHMAQAMGCPVLALFGPTNSTVLGPREDIHRTIYHPATREQGMAAITVDEVMAQCREMLGR